MRNDPHVSMTGVSSAASDSDSVPSEWRVSFANGISYRSRPEFSARLQTVAQYNTVVKSLGSVQGEGGWWIQTETGYLPEKNVDESILLKRLKKGRFSAMGFRKKIAIGVLLMACVLLVRHLQTPQYSHQKSAQEMLRLDSLPVPALADDSWSNRPPAEDGIQDNRGTDTMHMQDRIAGSWTDKRNNEKAEEAGSWTDKGNNEKDHGDTFDEWKCRFCCRSATSACWTDETYRSHFCDQCHDTQKTTTPKMPKTAWRSSARSSSASWREDDFKEATALSVHASAARTDRRYELACQCSAGETCSQGGSPSSWCYIDSMGACSDAVQGWNMGVTYWSEVACSQVSNAPTRQPTRAPTKAPTEDALLILRAEVRAELEAKEHAISELKRDQQADAARQKDLVKAMMILQAELARVESKAKAEQTKRNNEKGDLENTIGSLRAEVRAGLEAKEHAISELKSTKEHAIKQQSESESSESRKSSVSINGSRGDSSGGGASSSGNNNRVGKAGYRESSSRDRGTTDSNQRAQPSVPVNGSRGGSNGSGRQSGGSGSSGDGSDSNGSSKYSSRYSSRYSSGSNSTRYSTRLNRRAGNIRASNNNSTRYSTRLNRRAGNRRASNSNSTRYSTRGGGRIWRRSKWKTDLG